MQPFDYKGVSYEASWCMHRPWKYESIVSISSIYISLSSRFWKWKYIVDLINSCVKRLNDYGMDEISQEVIEKKVKRQNGDVNVYSYKGQEFLVIDFMLHVNDLS